MLTESLRHGKPVVWFDSSDAGGAIRFNPRYFTRCHFSEANGIRHCLETLVDLGHSHAAYVSFHGPFTGWRQARGQLLEQISTRMGSLSVHQALSPGLLYDILFEPQFPSIVHRISCRCYPFFGDALRALAEEKVRKHSGPTPRPHNATALLNRWNAFLDRLPPRHGSDSTVPAYVRRCVEVLRGLREGNRWLDFGDVMPMLNQSPSMMVALTDPRITALIVPNDQDSFRVHRWLQLAGVAVPRYVSVISFDNYHRFAFVPVSTIDFGFGYLGYMAFHAIMGDIPVRKSRYGDVASRPHVSHRGSLGVPRV
jgi:hypothetical protein